MKEMDYYLYMDCKKHILYFRLLNKDYSTKKIVVEKDKSEFSIGRKIFGKVIRVRTFKINEAKESGADIYGSDEFIEKITNINRLTPIKEKYSDFCTLDFE